MAKSHWDEYAISVAKEMGHQWRSRWHGEIKIREQQERDDSNSEAQAQQIVRTEYHAVGYPARSLLGKLREEGIEGASQSRAMRDQYPGEGFTGRALLGRRVMAEVLDDQEKIAIEVHFWIQGLPVKVKAHALGWKVSTYWWRLNRAMRKFSGGLRSIQEVSN